MLVLLARGFSSRDLREPLCNVLGIDPSQLRPGRMSYDLCRLRLHGFIERLPHTHRYRLTEHGLRTAMFHSRVYNRVLRPGMSLLNSTDSPPPNLLHRRFSAMNQAINTFCDQAQFAA